MSISSQDKKGSWFRIGKPLLDTISKTITATTLHFSEFVRTFDIIIHATKKKIKVGNETVVELFVAPGNFPREEFTFQVMLQGLAIFFDYQNQNPVIWAVNLVPDGDAINGTINKRQIHIIIPCFTKHHKMFRV